MLAPLAKYLSVRDFSAGEYVYKMDWTPGQVMNTTYLALFDAQTKPGGFLRWSSSFETIAYR